MIVKFCLFLFVLIVSFVPSAKARVMDVEQPQPYFLCDRDDQCAALFGECGQWVGIRKDQIEEYRKIILDPKRGANRGVQCPASQNPKLGDSIRPFCNSNSMSCEIELQQAAPQEK